jgi:hypothetical protein
MDGYLKAQGKSFHHNMYLRLSSLEFYREFQALTTECQLELPQN